MCLWNANYMYLWASGVQVQSWERVVSLTTLLVWSHARGLVIQQWESWIKLNESVWSDWPVKICNLVQSLQDYLCLLRAASPHVLVDRPGGEGPPARLCVHSTGIMSTITLLSPWRLVTAKKHFYASFLAMSCMLWWSVDMHGHCSECIQQRNISLLASLQQYPCNSLDMHGECS